MGMSGYQPGPCLCQHPPRLNKIPTSLFGDQFKGRRRRKIQPHKRKPKPPSSATQSEGRRRRTLYTPKKDSQPPPSAIHGPLAENGGYSPLKGFPNLRHRRSNQGVAEHGRYTHRKGFPNLRHRRSNQGVAEHGRYTPQKWIPNLHLRRPTKHSPKTEDTASRRIPNLPR